MAVREKDVRQDVSPPGAENPPFTPPEPAERAITITASELRALVAEQVAEATASSGLGLPPGAYRGEDGAVYRDVQVPTGRTRAVKDATGKVVREQAVTRTVARTVLLVAETSPGGIRSALKAAKLRADQHGPDVWHPKWKCWFKWGAKRAEDLPENLGEVGTTDGLSFHDIQPDPSASVLLSDIEENEHGQ